MYGIVVEVRDAVTGAPAAEGARLIVRDGSYVETVDGPFTPSLPLLHAAGERAGMYTVTVQKAGYLDWVRTGIEVVRDACHVSTVELEAVLQPSG